MYLFLLCIFIHLFKSIVFNLKINNSAGNWSKILSPSLLLSPELYNKILIFGKCQLNDPNTYEWKKLYKFCFNPERSHAQLCRLLLNPFLSLRVPCYIHFQEEPPRAGLQAAKCKSHNQSPNQSVLDCCKPQGASISI